MKPKTISALIVWTLAAQAFGASVIATNESAFTEIQQAIRTYTNDTTSLRAVGLKYKDAEDVEVSGAAHAALIRANDVSEFTNVFARYREALLAGTPDRRRFSSLMGLYVRHAHSSIVTSELKSEISVLDSDEQDVATDNYRQALLGLVLDCSPDLVPDTWLHREVESIVTSLTNRYFMMDYHMVLDSAMRELATRGNSSTTAFITRLRQLKGQSPETYCKRYEWMYRITAASHPEDMLQQAIATGDDILEHWCIRFMHQKRLVSMLTFAEQRSHEVTGLTKDFYLTLIRDLMNPDQIKGPIGSYENPVHISEPLIRPPVGDDAQQK